MARAALEGEFGGEGDEMLGELAKGSLEDPEKFARELYGNYGESAVPYLGAIARYAASGDHRPEDEEESKREEQEFESIVQETEHGPDQPGTDA